MTGVLMGLLVLSIALHAWTVQRWRRAERRNVELSKQLAAQNLHETAVALSAMTGQSLHDTTASVLRCFFATEAMRPGLWQALRAVTRQLRDEIVSRSTRGATHGR